MDAADIDMDYFQSLLDSKTGKHGNQSNYSEQLAVRQMSETIYPEEELASALGEIRKNEKEMSIIAMVAQTLLKNTNYLQEQVK